MNPDPVWQRNADSRRLKRLRHSSYPDNYPGRSRGAQKSRTKKALALVVGALALGAGAGAATKMSARSNMKPNFNKLKPMERRALQKQWQREYNARAKLLGRSSPQPQAATISNALNNTENTATSGRSLVWLTNNRLAKRNRRATKGKKKALAALAVGALAAGGGASMAAAGRGAGQPAQSSALVLAPSRALVPVGSQLPVSLRPNAARNTTSTALALPTNRLRALIENNLANSANANRAWKFSNNSNRPKTSGTGGMWAGLAGLAGAAAGALGYRRARNVEAELNAAQAKANALMRNLKQVRKSRRASDAKRKLATVRALKAQAKVVAMRTLAIVQIRQLERSRNTYRKWGERSLKALRERHAQNLKETRAKAFADGQMQARLQAAVDRLKGLKKMTDKATAAKVQNAAVQTLEATPEEKAAVAKAMNNSAPPSPPPAAAVVVNSAPKTPPPPPPPPPKGGAPLKLKPKKLTQATNNGNWNLSDFIRVMEANAKPVLNVKSAAAKGANPLVNNVAAATRGALNRLIAKYEEDNQAWSRHLKNVSRKIVPPNPRGKDVAIQPLRIALGAAKLGTGERWEGAPNNADKRLAATINRMDPRARQTLREVMLKLLMERLAGNTTKRKFSFANLRPNKRLTKLEYTTRARQIEEAIRAILSSLRLGTFELPAVSQKKRGALLQDLAKIFGAAEARYKAAYLQGMQRLEEAAVAVVVSNLQLNFITASNRRRDALGKLVSAIRRFKKEYTPGEAQEMYDKRVRRGVSAIVARSPHHKSVKAMVKSLRDYRWELQNLDESYARFVKLRTAFETFKDNVQKADHAKFLPTREDMLEVSEAFDVLLGWEGGPLVVSGENKQGTNETSGQLRALNGLLADILSELNKFGFLKRFMPEF